MTRSAFDDPSQASQTIRVGNVSIGPDSPLAIIAGPCLAESPELCLEIGEAMRDQCAAAGVGYIFKASFDKANRSSIHSDRGPGLDAGVKMIVDTARRLGVPCTTDVHEPTQAQPIADGGVDLLQIPAFLCRQTDLLVASAKTGLPVNVKKGQFMSPSEMDNVVVKLRESGAEKAGLMLTERGTFFGYNQLVNDFAGLGDMMRLGWPVCFDATHSTQQPGGAGTATGGRPENAPRLAKCAVAAGCHALFMETHPDPSQGKSDKATMLPLDVALGLVDELAALRRIVNE